MGAYSKGKTEKEEKLKLPSFSGFPIGVTPFPS